MLVTSIVRSVALLELLMAGCSFVRPRFNEFATPMNRDTAELVLWRVRSQCKPSQDTAGCKEPTRVQANAYVLLWNGYVSALGAGSRLPNMNGYPLEPVGDVHGGPVYHVIVDSVATSAVRCDGGYNAFEVPALLDMPAISDSIRVPGPIALIGPATGDTIGFEGFVVRWVPIVGQRIRISLYGPSTGNWESTWTVDAATGWYLVPRRDPEPFTGGALYRVSIRLSVSAIGSTAGRPYSMRCRCEEEVKVWMRQR